MEVDLVRSSRGEDLVRPVGLIHRRQKPLTPTVTRFIQLLKDVNEEPARVAARS